MIDINSSVDILYLDFFLKILSTNDLTLMTSLLIGFTEDFTLEIVNLYVAFGDEYYINVILTEFIVVDIPLMYNIIKGRSTLTN